MTRYYYAATAPDGQPATGLARAKGVDAALMSLYHQGFRDIRLRQRKSFLQMQLSEPRIKREEVMNLSRQLAAFIRAGLPLIDAIDSLGAESTNATIRRIMGEVTEGLRVGEKLSDCLDRHPKMFPEFYRGIVRSAELTGQLDTVLDQLAGYLERDIDARRKIKSALIYPAMIAVMSLTTVIIMAWYVLPKFKSFFASLDAELPLTTRILLATTDFVAGWWWAILAVIAFVVASVLAILSTEAGQYRKDQFLLAIPVLGSTIQFTLVERFCRILSSMVGAGVGLPEALRVSTAALRNRVFIKALSHAGEAVLEGEGLSRPLAGTRLFPPTAARMMRVGEETGTLETQLEVTAKYYEGELDYKLKKLTALFEPVVIIAMGGFVGFVAVALVQAMYGAFSQVGV
jgi:type IV pilus assembly protein PilC